jgi:hypothetical protein
LTRLSSRMQHVSAPTPIAQIGAGLADGANDRRNNTTKKQIGSPLGRCIPSTRNDAMSNLNRRRRPKTIETAAAIKPRAIDELALAKFLPPDPAVWFDAALDAKLDVSVSQRYIGWAPPEDPRQKFSRTVDASARHCEHDLNLSTRGPRRLLAPSLERREDCRTRTVRAHGPTSGRYNAPARFPANAGVARSSSRPAALARRPRFALLREAPRNPRAADRAPAASTISPTSRCATKLHMHRSKQQSIR